MTDLNIAYGFFDEPQLEQQNFMNQKDIDSPNVNNNTDYNIEKNNNDNIQIDKPKKKKIMNPEIIEDRPSYQRHKENYNISNMNNNNNDSIPIPDYPYAKKNQNSNTQIKYDQYENTFWNRFTNKKTEVFKLIMFSLVILFAISLDRISTHYLSKYVNENVLTDNQELIIRIAYPVLIILILWIFKAI